MFSTDPQAAPLSKVDLQEVAEERAWKTLENVAGLAKAGMKSGMDHLARLRDTLIAGVAASILDVESPIREKTSNTSKRKEM